MSVVNPSGIAGTRGQLDSPHQPYLHHAGSHVGGLSVAGGEGGGGGVGGVGGGPATGAQRHQESPGRHPGETVPDRADQMGSAMVGSSLESTDELRDEMIERRIHR